MEDKSTIRIWHGVFALSALTLVIVSMIYWLYGKTGTGAFISGSAPSTKTLERKIAALEEENAALRSAPPKIKEVVVTKTVEVPTAGQECPKAEPVTCEPCPKAAPCAETAVVSTPAVSQAPESYGETKTAKLVAVDSVVCRNMNVGEWTLPATCKKALSDFAKQAMDPGRDFFVLTPMVDSKQYKGKQPELKQEGLGQFRIESAKKAMKSLVDPNVHIFSKKALQRDAMRGFILERYRVTESN